LSDGVSDVREALRAVTHGGRLSRERSRLAFEAIVAGSEPPAVVAGLLSALAVLGESAEELAGVVDVLSSRVVPPPVDPALAARAIDVCGTGGDGLGTFNVSTAAALVVAGAGVPVAKHGGRAVSSACGSADVLSALGVRIDMPPAVAAKALAEAGITFLFAPVYHGAMKLVAPLRKELGVRTIFNLAGPLANPLGVKRQIVGVDRPVRLPAVAGTLALRGVERAFVFSNEAGGDEILPAGETVVTELLSGTLRTFRISAQDFGLPERSVAQLAGGDVAANAAILLALLRGEPGPARETVLMNASAALLVAGRAESFKDGVGIAAASIDSGAASRALSTLVAVSQKDAG
jgi:anthranilate phosphoribosyltransferase